MTTTSKQLRRKHRKSAKPARQGPHPSHASGLERIHALKPAYVAWKCRTVTQGQALEDWAGLLGLLGSYAEFGLFSKPGVLAPEPFALMLKSIRRTPGDAAGQAMDRLDDYLHFLRDNARWRQADDDFDLLHALVLMRIPGRSPRRTPHECPHELALPRRWSIGIVQWAAYLVGEMLEGKLVPNCGESIALPIPGPAGPVLLAPGLHPLPMSVFTNLFTAMDAAYLFESEADEHAWDEDEDSEETWESDGGPYPTHLGMALLQDDHPRNHEAARALLTAYLRNLVLARPIPGSGMAGLRRADTFFSVLVGVATEASAATARGEANLLCLGEDIKDQLADRFGETSGSLLDCLQSGILEYLDGSLVAQPVVHEAINDLRDEYAAESRALTRQRTSTPTTCVVSERRPSARAGIALR